MAWDPNQGQPDNPNTGYGPPPDPYNAPPENPYANAPENPYANQPENPYANAPQNPYANQPAAYGAPGYQGYNAPPQSAPLPLGEAIRNLPNQYIKVTTKPGPMAFAEEMGKASWDIVWVQLIFYAIISTILSYLATLISGSSLNSTASGGSVNPALLNSIRSITLGITFGQIILIPLFFFIGMAIIYGIARAFGGQGRFVTQSYSYLLFDVPLGVASSLIGLIPIAGGLIGIAIGIYRIVLAIFSVMAVHRLSGGRATAVVLIPIGVALLLACALVVLFVALFAAALQQR